jgi:hypothetical protein
MTKEQCDLHIESVIGDWSASTLERALDSVFHRVDMQVHELTSMPVTFTPGNHERGE